MPSAPAIAFEFRPSRWPAALVLAVGMAAEAAVLHSALVPGVTIAVVAAAGGYSIVAAVRSLRSTVRAATWRGDGTWTVHGADGDEHEAVLRGHRVFGPLIVLRLAETAGPRHDLLLLPDNADADLRRRLRMRLSATTHTA